MASRLLAQPNASQNMRVTLLACLAAFPGKCFACDPRPPFKAFRPRLPRPPDRRVPGRELEGLARLSPVEHENDLVRRDEDLMGVEPRALEVEWRAGVEKLAGALGSTGAKRGDDDEPAHERRSERSA